MAAPIPLRAGPLTLRFDPSSGWLRHIRFGGCEVLRAVYPAVRDRFWNTPPNAVSNLSVTERDGGFHLTFDAECRSGPVHFAFRGEIVGTADGAVTYRFDGEPRTTFRRNRIGLCVLHPISGCAGRPCLIEHADGTTETARFPAEISPHQPFHSIRAMTHEPVSGVRVEVRFTGDVFETEDQRNWTDASFKTYPTPLSLPHPVEVKPGDSVRQTVTVRVIGTAPATPPVPEAVIALGGKILSRLPVLGFGIADRPPSPDEVALLRELKPHHLRVDLHPADSDTKTRLRAASAEAAALGAKLEVAVLLGDDADAELRRLAETVAAVRPPVGSWLICKGMTDVAGEAELAVARRHLGGYDPAARFGVGTNLYFTQLNRTRPPLGDAAFVAFSVNPQVHTFDDESVVETLDGQTEVAANAVRLTGGRGVAVTPVTLRPRFNPNGSDGPDPLADPDPRQRVEFAAAWALGSVRRLAEAGAESVTYFQTAGPRGLLDGVDMFPAYRLFADLTSMSDWAVDTCVCSRPLEAEGLVFRNGERWVVLVADLTPRPLDVSFPFAADRRTLAPHSVARIDGQ